MGGGKGGIGKSLLTASLGFQLARMGKRVVLVDADLGAANLHTCLGLPGPERTLADFIQRRVERIEDVVVDTGVPGLRLISGASDFLGAANIKYVQKVRVLNRIRALDVDVVLLDLGAGTSFNIIDFFLISDVSILTVVPEPTSIENGYRFIKSALYRRLRNVATHEGVRQIVDAALDPKNPLGIKDAHGPRGPGRERGPGGGAAPDPGDGGVRAPLRGEPGAGRRRRAHRPSAGGGLRAPPRGQGRLRRVHPLRRRGLAERPPASPVHGRRAHRPRRRRDSAPREALLRGESLSLGW